MDHRPAPPTLSRRYSDVTAIVGSLPLDHPTRRAVMLVHQQGAMVAQAYSRHRAAISRRVRVATLCLLLAPFWGRQSPQA